MQQYQQKGIDLTLAPTRGKQISKNAEELHKCFKTHFTKSEIEGLVKIYTQLTPKKLDRTTFRDILQNYFEMTQDLLMDRVFRAFDKDNDSLISLEEWVKGMSVYLRGDLKERSKFAFNVYDLNGDGVISREEMFHLLKEVLMKLPNEEDPDEGIKDLVEMCVKQLDFNRDARITEDAYCESVCKLPLLVEAFGKCFPDAKAKYGFECLFSDNPKLYSCD